MSVNTVKRIEQLREENVNLKRRIGELEIEYERWYHKALELQQALEVERRFVKEQRHA